MSLVHSCFQEILQSAHRVVHLLLVASSWHLRLVTVIKYCAIHAGRLTTLQKAFSKQLLSKSDLTLRSIRPGNGDGEHSELRALTRLDMLSSQVAAAVCDNKWSQFGVDNLKPTENLFSWRRRSVDLKSLQDILEAFHFGDLLYFSPSTKTRCSFLSYTHYLNILTLFW